MSATLADLARAREASQAAATKGYDEFRAAMELVERLEAELIPGHSPNDLLAHIESTVASGEDTIYLVWASYRCGDGGARPHMTAHAAKTAVATITREEKHSVGDVIRVWAVEPPKGYDDPRYRWNFRPAKNDEVVVGEFIKSPDFDPKDKVSCGVSVRRCWSLDFGHHLENILNAR